jgi:hypothetical protein
LWLRARVKSSAPIFSSSRVQHAAPEQVTLMEAAFNEGGNKDVTAHVLPDPQPSIRA